MIFRCECCNLDFPVIYRNVHHKWPEALGGTNDNSNLAQLCPGCHDALHAIASLMLSRKPRQVTDQLKLIYHDNQQAQENCLKLAALVRDATIVTREKGLPDDHPAEVSASLRRKTKELVVVRARELNISQDEYVRGLIIKDLNVRYPSLRLDPLQERNVLKNRKR